jgi:DNA-binding CsgD family transcriptional regulator
MLTLTFPLQKLPILALMRVESGDVDGALELLEPVSRAVLSQESGLFWLSAALPIASALCTARSERAGDWLEPLARYRGCLFDWFVADIELGRIRALRREWEAAEVHFSDATELCRRRGLRPFLGQIHYHRALMLLARRASGDHRRALELLNEADAVFGELGLHYLREKVRAVLAAPRRGRPVSEGPRGLTARETNVVALLAEGKSNREIAAHLFVSERTVARHLENIYAKLGVTGRSAAAAWAVQAGIAAPPPGKTR